MRAVPRAAAKGLGETSHQVGGGDHAERSELNCPILDCCLSYHVQFQFSQREIDDTSSDAPSSHDGSEASHSVNSTSGDSEFLQQDGIDGLLDSNLEAGDWLPPKPPPVLRELLDSRYILPILFPSDPKYLRAVSMDPYEIMELGQEPNTPTPLKTLPFRLQPLNTKSVELRIMNLIDGERRETVYDIMTGMDNSTIANEEDENSDDTEEDNQESAVDLTLRPTSPYLTTLHPQPSLSRKARVSASE
jgi:hypothetical protein